MGDATCYDLRIVCIPTLERGNENLCFGVLKHQQDYSPQAAL